jgi:hypothetical protein
VIKGRELNRLRLNDSLGLDYRFGLSNWFGSDRLPLLEYDWLPLFDGGLLNDLHLDFLFHFLDFLFWLNLL